MKKRLLAVVMGALTAFGSVGLAAAAPAEDLADRNLPPPSRLTGVQGTLLSRIDIRPDLSPYWVIVSTRSDASYTIVDISNVRALVGRFTGKRVIATGRWETRVLETTGVRVQVLVIGQLLPQ